MGRGLDFKLALTYRILEHGDPRREKGRLTVRQMAHRARRVAVSCSRCYLGISAGTR